MAAVRTASERIALTEPITFKKTRLNHIEASAANRPVPAVAPAQKKPTLSTSNTLFAASEANRETYRSQPAWKPTKGPKASVP